MLNRLIRSVILIISSTCEQFFIPSAALKTDCKLAFLTKASVSHELPWLQVLRTYFSHYDVWSQHELRKENKLPHVEETWDLILIDFTLWCVKVTLACSVLAHTPLRPHGLWPCCDLSGSKPVALLSFEPGQTWLEAPVFSQIWVQLITAGSMKY